MMWDFRGTSTQPSDLQRSRSRSPHPLPHGVASSSNAPSFPIPQTSRSTYAYGAPLSSSYPPTVSSYPPYIAQIPSPSSAPPITIHVIHHHSKHKHKDKEKDKKKSKPRSASLERQATHTHTLSHSYSTSQLKVPFPIPFPSSAGPHSPHHIPHPIVPQLHYHQRSYSQPQTPAQVHFKERPSVIGDQNTSNVLHKRRPSITGGSQPNLQLTPYPTHHLPLPSPQKPLHGILKNSTQPQNIEPITGTFQYSRCTGRRRALCIGINYSSQPNSLRGCINDAHRVRDFLITHGGYRSSDIYLLTDEPPKGVKDGESWDGRSIPTRENMIRAMKWLVKGARKDDSLFLHYSGHGGQRRDLDGDEIDGLDEVIFPVDFRTAGSISDDEMHDIMVKPLPPGCRLTAIFDACHSGTVLDLPYMYSSHGRLKGSHIKDRARRSKASPADVISWTSCHDHQTSSDTFAGGMAIGAMSYAFVTSLTQKPHQTYQELLRSLRLILHPRFTQKPQLASSHHIDTNLQFIF